VKLALTDAFQEAFFEADIFTAWENANLPGNTR
jgi:hypothetical protein